MTPLQRTARRAWNRARRHVRLQLLVLACALVACSGAIEGAPDTAPGAAGSGSTLPRDGSATAGAAAANCAEVKLGPRRLWRLTPVQYDNTLRDLLAIDSAFGAGFPADEVVQGFNNAADALLVSPLLADKMQAAAQDVSGKVDLAKIAPCAGAQRDDACLRDFVGRFGERAFRRPLETADVDRYVKLGKAAADFESGARLVVSAMLQSPHFIYRFELGKQASDGRFELGDYEVASELSYLLWQSMPDDTLFAAAHQQALHTKAQVQQQVDRMLKSPRAKPVVRAFVFEWLGLGSILTVPKDTARFPELTSDVREALVAEAERFIDHVMFEQNGSVATLLTSPTTFLDAKLASFYGTPLPTMSADAIQPVDLAAQERRGILTLGGTMLAHSRSNDSSPVHRGKLVRERLLCQTMPPPPPGVVVQPPPLDPTKTTRERYAAHTSQEPCASCHRLMDPIGLAFEHFDGIGRFRPTDNGLAIDVSGQIIDSLHSDGTFVGTDQLIDKLEASSDARDCYALQWFRFAYGMNDDASRCIADRVRSAIADSDGSLAAIVGILTQADSFFAREPAKPATALPVTQTQPTQPTPPATPPSQPDAGAADAAKPDAAPEIPAELEVTITVNNDFGSGYCRTYQLRNRGTAPITWSIPLEVSGMLNQHWECKISGDTGRVTFSGEDYNRTLQADGMAQFGFCAQRS
jgi:hypothetical protein